MSQPQTQLGPSVALDLAPARRFRFSLRMMFGVTTAICVSLAVGIVAPGLGILMAFILTPALVRASAVLSIQRKASQRIGLRQLVAAFAGSVVATIVAGVALYLTSGIMFFLTMVAFNIGSDVGFIVCIACCLAVGALMGSYVFWTLWPNPDDRWPPT